MLLTLRIGCFLQCVEKKLDKVVQPLVKSTLAKRKGKQKQKTFLVPALFTMSRYKEKCTSDQCLSILNRGS